MYIRICFLFLPLLIFCCFSSASRSCGLYLAEEKSKMRKGENREKKGSTSAAIFGLAMCSLAEMRRGPLDGPRTGKGIPSAFWIAGRVLLALCLCTHVTASRPRVHHVNSCPMHTMNNLEQPIALDIADSYESRRRQTIIFPKH